MKVLLPTVLLLVSIGCTHHQPVVKPSVAAPAIPAVDRCDPNKPGYDPYKCSKCDHSTDWRVNRDRRQSAECRVLL
jgi:hypothetical protein